MRKDMHKVIVERPRRGRYMELRVQKQYYRDDNDMPFMEGMNAGRRRGYNRKEFSDFLNPLERFLRSRVGHRWDDVYSEIAANLDINKTTHHHVLVGHLPYMVYTQTFRNEDGEICANDRGRGGEVVGGWYRSNLYVDPDTGILCCFPEVAAPWRRGKDKDEDRVEIDKDHDYVRVNGIWYEVWYAEIPEPELKRYIDENDEPKMIALGVDVKPDGSVVFNGMGHSRAYDVLRNSQKTRHRGQLYWNRGRTRYGSRYVFEEIYAAIRKRQLNSKELRRHGLVNEVVETNRAGRHRGRHNRSKSR